MCTKYRWIILISVIFMGGCVTGTRSLDLTVPQYQNEKSATGSIYIASIEDNRTFEDRPRSASTPSVKGELATTPKEKLVTLIGRQRNGFGKAIGDVTLPENSTVIEETRDLLQKGLEGRGYTITPNQAGAIRLNVRIDKFWAWMSMGFWSVGFDSEIQYRLNFSGPDINQEFDVSGSGVNRAQVARNANWALTYQRAYSDLLKNLDQVLDDRGL